MAKEHGGVKELKLFIMKYDVKIISTTKNNKMIQIYKKREEEK